MRVVVDNSSGGEASLADDVARGLRERGFDVELRAPAAASIFDTGVHVLEAGLELRVAARPQRAELDALEAVVKAALQQRPSTRRRTRAIPVRLGDGARVVQWIDVFG